MFLELPWERNADGRAAYLDQKWRKISPALMRAIAASKLNDVALISATFKENVPILFEQKISVFFDSSRQMEFFGCYSRAFLREEDKSPFLCLRKASWTTATERPFYRQDFQTQKEYLLRGEQINSRIVYLERAEARQYLELIHEFSDRVKEGLNWQETIADEAPAVELDEIFYNLVDDYFSHRFHYSPYQYKCERLEDWTLRWREAFQEIDETMGIIPKGSSRIGYERSVLDYFQRLNEFSVEV